jgi:hypothetical protein
LWDSIVQRLAKISIFLFSVGIIGALYLTWINRNEPVWIPDSGPGYYIGIIGGSMMLLLLLYPMRKKMKFMSRMLPIKYWFRIHMIFGVLGPTLVLLHSNFQLGSVNGRVALFSMLAVAISGLFGKYIYKKIHNGLYGRRITFNERRTESNLLTKKMGQLMELVPETRARLISLEARAIDMPSDFIRSFVKGFAIRVSSLIVYREILRKLNLELEDKTVTNGWSPRKLKAHKKTVRILIRAHKNALLQVAESHFYERLFSIWHVLHLPLFIMMMIAGFIHVYAVHVY